MSRWPSALWVWAARDVLRRPGQALLAGLAMATLVAALGAVLSLSQGLTHTLEALQDEGPSLVVRRLGPGGWAPVPTDALETVRGVRGVTRAHARRWGVVAGPRGAITVMAVDPGVAIHGLETPAPGHAWAGPGLAVAEGVTLPLQGAEARSLAVLGVLPSATALVAHDVLLVSESDARALLGLGEGQASDIAVQVFHEAEAAALAPELVAALPFPVRLITADQSLRAARARVEARAGVRTLLLVPALLGLALLVAGMASSWLSARREVGLLKALGWTSADVVGLHLRRALVIALPALALGWAAAWWLVHGPGRGWVGSLLFGWSGAPPSWELSPTGGLLVLLQIGGLVLAPWLAAALLPALRAANADPDPWLRGEEVG